MKSDPTAVISKVAHFIGKTYTEDEIRRIADETSFDAMKTRSIEKIFAGHEKMDPNFPFFRKGVAGSWKSELFTDEQISYVDSRIRSVCEQYNLNFD